MYNFTGYQLYYANSYIYKLIIYSDSNLPF